MDQEQLVDRNGAKAPPDSEKPNVDKRAVLAAGAKARPAHPAWIRNVNDYDRRERSEYQVIRFG
jgi:hypothetical protein